MDHPLLKKFWSIAQWLFGAAVLVWLALMIADQWEDIRSVSIAWLPGYLVGAVTVLSLFYLLYGATWVRILTWLRGGEDGWSNLVQARIFFMSILTRYLPAGKVVNVGSRIELYHRQGGRRATAFAAVIIEQLFFMGGAVFLLWVVLLVDEGVVLPEQIIRLRPLLVLGGVVVLLVLLFFDRLLQLAVNRLHLTQFDGILIGFSWGQKFELLLRFVGVNLLQGLASYVFFRSVAPLPDSSLGFMLYAGAAYPLSRLIGQLVAFVPGGLGVREGIYALLLQAYAPVGVLLVAAAIVRLASMLLELLIVSGLVLATRSSPRSS